ncbi:MAG: M28 family peptidase [Leptolyngbyaceae cyanobacterium bins.302]|nr:M28 family peptidase [Leptolyngbyaceae cyanobacterium bins.302]
MKNYWGKISFPAHSGLNSRHDPPCANTSEQPSHFDHAWSDRPFKQYPQHVLVSVGVLVLGLIGCSPSYEATTEVSPPSTLVQSTHSSQNVLSQNASSQNADVDALIKLGPRVAGTPVMEQASRYLMEEYRKAGYVAEVQTFTYEKFEDQGSTLRVNGSTLKGLALRGTATAQPTARLVAVPNVGRTADFASVDVRGAIAIVQRGEIPFSEKAKNAAAAGAVGLVIVNNAPDDFMGTLTQETTLPVLGISGEQGKPLLERARQESLSASLTVNAGRRQVTGRNVVAHLPGVTQPKVLLGGHYDSVVDSPGGNDNASGTATVLAIARQLSRTPQARDVWFVAFDGEEDGLHGSRAFVKTAQPQLLKGLKGMLNFDMVGVNEQLRVSGTPALTQLAKAAETDVETAGSAGGSSDHASFAAADVPILFFHRGLDPNYHKPTDTIVEPKLVNETAEVALKVIEQLLQ